MRARFFLALALAFSPLLLAQPAYAWDTTSGHLSDGSVQFDYRGGSATQTLQAPEGSTLTITINNTIANCIGNCVPRPDTWALTINGERWSGNTIETVTITAPVSGEVTLVASGKDEGFWSGWYGPIFSAPIITSPEPTPEPVETGTWEGQVFTATAPEGLIFTAVTGWYGSPTDPNCGADVSTILATYLGGNTFTVGSDNGVFGDPCGGVVKVLRVNLTATPIAPVEPTPSPTPTIIPEPTPTPTPTVETPIEPPVSQPEPPAIVTVDAVDVPVVPPVVTPPVIEPQPQPQPIPYPVQPAPAPEPAPTPEPTPEPAPPTAEPAPPTAEPAPPTPEPTPEPPQPAPTPVVEPKPTVAPLPPVEAPKPPVQPEVKLDLKTVDPETITPVQQAIITQQAVAVLATAEQGSPAYEQALEALAVVAEADDPELPAELAAIPLIGNVAGAVMDTFNAVGNIGADISPKERKKGQQVVVGTVIVGQMASVALLRR